MVAVLKRGVPVSMGNAKFRMAIQGASTRLSAQNGKSMAFKRRLGSTSYTDVFRFSRNFELETDPLEHSRTGAEFTHTD